MKDYFIHVGENGRYRLKCSKKVPTGVVKIVIRACEEYDIGGFVRFTKYEEKYGYYVFEIVEAQYRYEFKYGENGLSVNKVMTLDRKIELKPVFLSGEILSKYRYTKIAQGYHVTFLTDNIGLKDDRKDIESILALLKEIKCDCYTPLDWWKELEDRQLLGFSHIEVITKDSDDYVKINEGNVIVYNHETPLGRLCVEFSKSEWEKGRRQRDIKISWKCAGDRICMSITTTKDIRNNTGRILNEIIYIFPFENNVPCIGEALSYLEKIRLLLSNMMLKTFNIRISIVKNDNAIEILNSRYDGILENRIIRTNYVKDGVYHCSEYCVKSTQKQYSEFLVEQAKYRRIMKKLDQIKRDLVVEFSLKECPQFEKGVNNQLAKWQIAKRYKTIIGRGEKIETKVLIAIYRQLDLMHSKL